MRRFARSNSFWLSVPESVQPLFEDNVEIEVLGFLQCFAVVTLVRALPHILPLDEKPKLPVWARGNPIDLDTPGAARNGLEVGGGSPGWHGLHRMKVFMFI
jgi:hypothetical protein